MLKIKQYVKAESLEQAYELNQKKTNRIVGGMLWLKMSTAQIQTAIDLSGLGLDQIEETEDAWKIGCMVSLRDLELHEGLNELSCNLIRESVRSIVGVQFRNLATIGGSIFGRFGFSDVLTCFLALDTEVELYKGGIISLKKETERAEKYSKDVRVKTPSVMQLSGNLSGGNQQKVVIAKLLCRNPDILIFDEPTVGVDVGAKEEIYKIMEELTAQGKGIILISSYLPEVMGLSDRLFVMAQGRITGEFNYDEIKVLKEEDVLKKASVEG